MSTTLRCRRCMLSTSRSKSGRLQTRFLLHKLSAICVKPIANISSNKLDNNLWQSIGIEGRYRMGSRNIAICDLYAIKFSDPTNNVVAWIALTGCDARCFQTVTPNVLCKLFCLVTGVRWLLLNFAELFLNIFLCSQTVGRFWCLWVEVAK